MFVIGIQARSGSTRLPNKALLDLHGKPVWKWVWDAVHDLYPTYMLIPWGNEDIAMYHSVDDQYDDVQWICESEKEPLERYKLLMRYIPEAVYLIRLTADCPLVNRYIIQDMASVIRANNWLYLQEEADGMDVQIIHRKLFEDERFQDPEHVLNIQEIKDNGFYHCYEMHLSIDTSEQYKHIVNITKGAL